MRILFASLMILFAGCNGTSDVTAESAAIGDTGGVKGVFVTSRDSGGVHAFAAIGDTGGVKGVVSPDHKDSGGVKGVVGTFTAAPGQFAAIDLEGSTFIASLQLTDSAQMTVQGTLSVNPAGHVLLKLQAPGQPPVAPSCPSLGGRLAHASALPVQAWLAAGGNLTVEDLCATDGTTYTMYPLTDGGGSNIQ